MKDELLRSMYTSLADVHFIVLGCREIHVASLGDDQFSLGAAAPPSAAIADVISACSSGKRRLGGRRAGFSFGWSCWSPSESVSDSPSSSWLRGGGG